MSDEMDELRRKFLERVEPLERELDELYAMKGRARVAAIQNGAAEIEIVKVRDAADLKRRAMDDPGHVYVRASFALGILFPVFLAMCPALRDTPSPGLLAAHERGVEIDRYEGIRSKAQRLRRLHASA